MQRDDPDARALVAAAPYPLVGLSPEGVVRSWNPAAQRLLGYSESEVAGRSLAALMALPPDILRRAAQEPIEAEARARHRSFS